MRILIDTNIFIYRENYHIIPGNLQSLLKTLNDLVVQILVHPLSVHELEKDRNQERRAITLSKIKTYPLLDNPPPLKSDQQFLTFVGQTNNAHELVDC
jgi:rRNA-processing protein FCF1